MQLDIRLPIGLMFSVLGLLLMVVGLSMSREISQSPNVNLWWGGVMFMFGIIMFFFGRRGTATARLAEESPEGRKIEEAEHRSEAES